MKGRGRGKSIIVEAEDNTKGTMKDGVIRRRKRMREEKREIE